MDAAKLAAERKKQQPARALTEIAVEKAGRLDESWRLLAGLPLSKSNRLSSPKEEGKRLGIELAAKLKGKIGVPGHNGGRT